MERKIKLIWDFKGPNAKKTAAHHEKHLKEYIALENIEQRITGYQQVSDVHSIAFMVVGEAEMITVRDALRPHRGAVYESSSPSE